MLGDDKPLVWLAGEIKTPPFSPAARIEVGFLLRRLQRGDALAMPHARPMPVIGSQCLELRVRDERHQWRVIVRVDPDAVVIAEVFAKQTRATPVGVIAASRQRLKRYDEVAGG